MEYIIRYMDKKERNRLNQKKFRDTHREDLNAKRRTTYNSNKVTKEQPKCDCCQHCNKPIEPPPPAPTYSTTLEELMNDISQLKEGNNTNTTTTYFSSLKRLSEILGNPKNLAGAIKKPTETIPKIQGTTYSDNTKLGLYKVVLFLIDNHKINISKENRGLYSDEFTLLDRKTRNTAKQEINELELMPVPEYLKLVDEKFGKVSLMSIFARLVIFYGFRDNFVMKIIPSENEATDDKENYVIIPPKKNVEIILNNYKTKTTFDRKKIKIDAQLSNLIREYYDNEKKKIKNDYLFGITKRTQFISNHNKLIGIDGGINYLRKLGASVGTNDKEDLEIAKKMGHSYNTHLDVYKKN